MLPAAAMLRVTPLQGLRSFNTASRDTVFEAHMWCEGCCQLRVTSDWTCAGQDVTRQHDSLHTVGRTR